ncbi:MAG: helix-turn-helix domain-containing protein [Clostridia bacterium]|nr:helix-turn-helix domain-containing protein [Clostridia bacterium]
MTLSEKIAYCRRRQGLSQEALAERLDVSRQAVSKWETGEAQPEIGKLRALAAEFHVTADWLLSDEEPIETPIEPLKTETQGKTWPTWVENLPGALGRLFKRFGWLAGVYVALGGLGFILVGALALGMGTLMVSQTQQAEMWFDEPGPGFGMDGITVQWYDEAGNPIDGPSDVALEALGLPAEAQSPAFGGLSVIGIFGTVILGVGLVITVGGVVLAIVLHQWGKARE